MADRSILFTDFNAPDAEKPGEFQSSYNPRKIEQALERSVKDIQRKLSNARQEFEELKTVQNDRFESNKELTELLSANPADYFDAIAPDLQKNNSDEYNRLKDLLARNVAEFQKEGMAKLSQEKKDIRLKLIEGQANYQKRRMLWGKAVMQLRHNKITMNVIRNYMPSYIPSSKMPKRRTAVRKKMEFPV